MTEYNFTGLNILTGYFLFDISLISVIVFIAFIFLKKLRKGNTVMLLAAIVLPCLILYLMFGPNYQKMKISDETKNRLLSFSLESIELEKLKTEPYGDNGYDIILNEDENFYNQHIPYILLEKRYDLNFEREQTAFKIFGQTFEDSDTEITVLPRESNKTKYDFPFLTEYSHRNTVYIAEGKQILIIHFDEKENDDVVLNAILDRLEEK